MIDRFMFRAWVKEYGRFIERRLIDGHEASLTWEQCTGLKDKNGKLIYEGDICRIKGTYYDCDYKDYIDIDETEKIYSLEKFFGEAMVKGVYSALGCENLSVEVIGNIHENPELLEEKAK